MSRAIRSCCLLFVALVSGHTGLAQLNLHIDEHFFSGKEIYKVETTNDGWVWVLGEDNFIARISPSDEVEVLTAFFADYSTKPFTDISSHMSDTLLLGTDGDYAFLFVDGTMKHYGRAQGIAEAKITSVAIRKQGPTGSSPEARAPIIVTTGNMYGSIDFLHFSAPDENTYYYGKPYQITQNDRKGFNYLLSIATDGRCYDPGVSNLNLLNFGIGGSWLWEFPIDAFIPSVGEMSAYVTPRVNRDRSYHFSVYWAGKTGLHYLSNDGSCHNRSVSIPYFEDKSVQAINELHLLAANEAFLSYMIIGTDDGLYVSSDSHSYEFSMRYAPVDVLGDLSVYDMESISTGTPINSREQSYVDGDIYCEKSLYVASSEGLYKIGFSLAPVEETLHIEIFGNGLQEDNTMQACGSGSDILRVPFGVDANNSVQWQLDGSDIIGADTSFVHLTEPGVYRAVMWFRCENIEIHSQEVTVSIDEAPEFTFDYPDTVDVCEGDVFPLEVTAAQPGYSYQWFRNGAPIDGETLPLFTVREEGMYHVGVNACGDHFVFSDSITVRFHRLEKPTTNDGNILVCQGQTRILTVTGYAPDVIKRWYHDGVLIPGESDTILQVTEPGYYQVELTRGPCSVVSDPLTVRFELPPVAQIQAANEGPLCYGTSTTLTADHPTAGAYTYDWSTGETTRSIQVNTAGVYTLVLTNAAGCSDTTAITLQVYDPIPAPPIRDTVLCGATNETIRVEAPAGYSAYLWNGGVSSGRYFDVSAPGVYSLEVQDEKGCAATTTFEVKPYCEDIIIPNTFSPNGDGINDTWIIGGLEDSAAMVTVFDRNGQLVFQSRGYSIPWDGLYKGRLVPVGAYYYHIATSGGKSFKGALNVLY